MKHAVPAHPRSVINWTTTISDEALRHQVLSEAIEESPEASAYLKTPGIEFTPSKQPKETLWQEVPPHLDDGLRSISGRE
ncbi:hypothetical protein N8586_01920 [Verrucomicrobiales bacterium]|nr:hypothetical protein [Verrucomicrobiales bacterium]